MTTSDPRKLVFFKKEGCGPCELALARLQSVLTSNPEFEEHVTILQKENHTALVEAYELKMYPTVLILNQEMDEIGRKVGVNTMPSVWWYNALKTIHVLKELNY